MSVRKSLAWSFFAQGTAGVATFAGTVVVARLLSPAEMGIYAVALATFALLSIVSTVGASAYIVREVDLPPSKVNTAFTVNALLCIGLAAILYFISTPASHFLREPAVGPVLRLLAIRPLLTIFEFRPNALLQREMDFKVLSVITAVGSMINAFIMVAAALAGHSYNSLAFGVLAGGLTNVFLFNFWTRRHIGFRLSLAYWRQMTSFCIRMVTISGMALFAQRISEVIMGRLLGLPALGLFTRATQISDLIFLNVYGTITRVMFVKMARDYREHGNIKETYLRGVEVITAIMWPILIGLAILSPPAIFIVFGESWLGAAAPLSLLMIAQVLATCFAMNWELFVLRDQTAKQTQLELVRAIGSVAAFTGGCFFSTAAAAAGRIVDSILGLVLYHKPIRQLAGLDDGILFRIFGKSSLLTVAAVFPSLGLMVWNDWSPYTSPAAIAGALATGIVLWILAIAQTRHPLLGEIRRLMPSSRST
jgi:O-antigen/teichoic acid export membrane protein